MGPPARRHLVAVLLAACVVTTVGIGMAVPIDVTDATLVVTDADSGERLLEIPVERGETVTLAYTHSVEKTPVRDVYVVGDGELRMIKMEFDSYGAGLPADADVDRTEDGLVASVDRSYERLSVVPGSIAGHELEVGETRYDLVALAEDEDECGDGEQDEDGRERKNESERVNEAHSTGLVLFVEDGADWREIESVERLDGGAERLDRGGTLFVGVP